MHVFLIGTFRLVDPEGKERSPSGTKACAIVAMLATATERRRTRRWLEAHLWSDREGEQASGSLRQALYQVRQALGPHAGMLKADREYVWIEGLSTDIETDPAAVAQAVEAGRVFLEGIDIPDEAFEDWLVAERARFAPPDRPARKPGPKGAGALPFLVQVSDFGGGTAGFLPAALSSEIARLIGDLAEIDIYHVSAGKSAIVMPVRGLRLTIESARFGAEIHLVATISNIAQRRVAWTRRARFPADPAGALDSAAFSRLAYEAAEAAHAALALAVEPDSETWAQGRQAQAVRAIFTFERSQLDRADRLLRESLEVRPSAQGWAWLAFLRQTEIIERTSTDKVRTQHEAEDAARRALAFPGRNSTVLALISQLNAMVSMDPQAAHATAEEAVAINPLNPYARYALAAANLRAGKFTEALAQGRVAADTAQGAQNGFFFEGISALAALSLGDLDGCLQIYSGVSHRAPNFRSALRPLTVLSLLRGDHARMQAHIAQMERIEEGFSLDRLLHDDGYPGVTLRSLGLLKRAARRL